MLVTPCSVARIGALELLYSRMLFQSAEGDYEVHVQVNTYQNQVHRHSQRCCGIFTDPLGNCLFECDNYFLFCLRPFGFNRLDKTCPSAQAQTEQREGDDVTFGEFIGGHPNPVILEVSGRWEVR